MRAWLSGAALALGVVVLTATPAQAKGCLKGAAVGGAAGHVVGEHGVAGAAAGCVVGRHRANKKDKAQNTGSETARGSARTAPDGDRPGNADAKGR